MLTPQVEEFSSPKSPWEVFRALSERSETAFFLDSPHYAPPDQRYSYLGACPFSEVILQQSRLYVQTARKTSVYPAAHWQTVLRRLLRKYRVEGEKKFDFFTGGAVGYFGYECAGLFDRINFRSKPGLDVPLIRLGLYRDVIVYDHRRRVYYLVTLKSPQESAAQIRKRREALKRMFDFTETTGEMDLAVPEPTGFYPEISRTDFVAMVRRAKDYIAAGDIYQANLSQRFRFRYEGNALDLYGHLRTINPSPFSSFLKMGDFQIISCSPERLIRKTGRLCETRPIAGTRPRKMFPLTPDQIERDLLENEKERAEHIMLLDLERNDLGRVCDFKTVQVREMMTIERYSHVIHIVSKVTGRLNRSKDMFDLIPAMFPGGTITGCPKIRCMQIIDELEPVTRGLYTGSIGYLDFNGDLDLNIVIRTILLQGGQGYLQTGAGIVHDSDPQKEYEETLHKGEALVCALAQSYL